MLIHRPLSVRLLQVVQFLGSVYDVQHEKKERWAFRKQRFKCWLWYRPRSMQIKFRPNKNPYGIYFFFYIYLNVKKENTLMHMLEVSTSTLLKAEFNILNLQLFKKNFWGTFWCNMESNLIPVSQPNIRYFCSTSSQPQLTIIANYTCMC